MRDHKQLDATLKAVHKQWQTMRICHRWKLSKTAECPSCHQCEESLDHVLQCQNEHIIT